MLFRSFGAHYLHGEVRLPVPATRFAHRCMVAMGSGVVRDGEVGGGEGGGELCGAGGSSAVFFVSVVECLRGRRGGPGDEGGPGAGEERDEAPAGGQELVLPPASSVALSLVGLLKRSPRPPLPHKKSRSKHETKQDADDSPCSELQLP